MRALALLVLLALCAMPARAHEVRPAYLEVTETETAGEFGVVWKAPAIQAGVLAVSPVFPESCSEVSPTRPERAPGAVVTRWRIDCAGGLHGEIRLDGLDRTLTSAFIRVRADGRLREGVVTSAAPSFALDARGPPPVADYLILGARHILEGFDHLAFVIGLILVVSRWRLLVWTLTAFTLAHTITLSAAALGIVGLPQRPVEAVIAFSIAVVAREIVLAARGEGGAVSRAPWAIAFGFGLLHGFGFAGALNEIGLPEGARLMALVLFNVGVELGQLLVAALVVPLLMLLRRAPEQLRSRAELGAGFAMGGLAMFWLAERVF